MCSSLFLVANAYRERTSRIVIQFLTFVRSGNINNTICMVKDWRTQEYMQESMSF